MDPKPVEPTPLDVSADQPSEAVVPEIVTADPLQTVRAELAQLHARGTSGAGWFFWIAALSLINSIILLSGGDRHFVVGLGVTSIAVSGRNDPRRHRQTSPPAGWGRRGR